MKKQIAFFIAITLLLPLFTVCVTSAQTETMLTEFLEELYTVDYETALENIAKLDAEQDWEVVVQLKKVGFSRHITTDGSMIFLTSSGWPLLQIRAILEDGFLVPTDVKIKKLENSSYHFELLVELRNKENIVTDKIPQEGYLILSRSTKIEKFYIKNERFLRGQHQS